MPIDSIRDYVANEFLPGLPSQALPGDRPLISGGIVDSVGTLRLVLWLEQQFAIEITTEDIQEGRLDTLSRMVELVRSKSASSGSSLGAPVTRVPPVGS